MITNGTHFQHTVYKLYRAGETGNGKANLVFLDSTGIMWPYAQLFRTVETFFGSKIAIFNDLYSLNEFFVFRFSGLFTCTANKSLFLYYFIFIPREGSITSVYTLAS